ncbi:MAG: accessory Sec system translocase SecA2, partial [Staphylococcus epidermidis]|nr:accessory Sec system translocase SecA2 [Staphylococcus epidermidis]MDU1499957.1 accessory Sec system translocase SecA2 [Staphylococcus epidermidis]MDU3951582.1 accessory Sec system translocase SecA2 [Staphylococcus epidermidis]MDU7023680.1 accessory Sec system translocase SecA2 [Staphylococcus epidermidis]
MAKGVNQIINNIRLRKLRKILNQINALSEEFSNFSDEALQAKTKEFKVYLNDNKSSLNHILPQAYATVREASKRVLGMYPKDVQILGAIAMHQGNIAEMQTGEGKTL